MTGRRIYLDHSATTPTSPRVIEAMAPYWSDIFGNSESPHTFGREAEHALEEARRTVAAVLGCYEDEVIFTASGTEADNLAIRGIAWAARRDGRGNHIVTTPIEHSAVGRTVGQLRDLFGFEVTPVPVDGHGLVSPDDVAAAIRPDTVLVSVMAANNEIGTVEPLTEIGRLCRERQIPFHTDAVQAAGRLPLRVDALGVDSLALSAHKFYGPKGVGLLYLRRGVDLVPALTGAGHEGGRRPGTVHVGGAVGLATALRLAEEEREEETVRLTALRDRLIESVLARIPDARLTGHPVQRLCHHASFIFRGVAGGAIVRALDEEGIAASAGAACAGEGGEPSTVLGAIGVSGEWGLGGLRLTLGHLTDEEDITRVLDVLPPIVARLRAGR